MWGEGKSSKRSMCFSTPLDENELAVRSEVVEGCSACRLRIKAIEKFVDSAIKDILLPYLQKQCEDAVSKADRDMCESVTGIIEQKLSSVIDQFFKPSTFCVMIGACRETDLGYGYDYDDSEW